MEQGWIIGAVGGSALGVLGGLWGALAGTLAPKGHAKSFVLTSGYALLAICAASLVAGLIALALGAQWVLWFSLLLIGVVGVGVFGLNLPVVKKRYLEAEHRRMMAMDLTGGQDADGSPLTAHSSWLDLGNGLKRLMPWFAGRLEVDRVPSDFADRLRQRLARGYASQPNPVGTTGGRCNYEVSESMPGEITMRARTLSTAIAIGLNDARITIPNNRTIEYEVTFWRWTNFSVSLCGAIVTPILAAYVLLDGMREQVASYGLGQWPFWVMAVFFGILWPWILTGLHKKHAARLLERILGEATAQVD